MVMKTATIHIPLGLQHDPAIYFVQRANEYHSSIWLADQERRVNAKSLLGVLSLQLREIDSPVTILADGDDEQRAVDALCGFVENSLE